MRTARIPYVLIHMHEETPKVALFNEGTTEAKICEILSDQWLIQETPPAKTIDELNDLIDGADLILLFEDIEVFGTE